MAVYELIEPSQARPVRARSTVVRAECHDMLQTALRTGKTIRVTLAPNQRSGSYVSQLRREARALRIDVQVTRSDRRPVRTKTGEDGTDWAVLFVSICKTAPPPRATTTSPDRRQFEPITRAEISR